MTVQTAKIQLFKYFSSHETFDLNKDFSLISFISDDPEIDKGIIKLALKEFEEQKLASKLDINEKNIWVLNKPLNSFVQNIEIDAMTAQAVSEVINCYCKDNNDTINISDPLQITDREIKNILVLLDLAKNGGHNSDLS